MKKLILVLLLLFTISVSSQTYDRMDVMEYNPTLRIFQLIDRVKDNTYTFLYNENERVITITRSSDNKSWVITQVSVFRGDFKGQLIYTGMKMSEINKGYPVYMTVTLPEIELNVGESRFVFFNLERDDKL